MNRVATNYTKLLPEILGQWKIFEENHVESLASSRLVAVAMDMRTQIGLTTVAQYEHERIALHFKRLLREEKEITKMRIMRVFLFGAYDDDPFPTSWGKLNWTSSLQKNSALRKWAVRIAHAYANRFAKAVTRWELILDELESNSPG
jgi:hypothetical protein